MHILQLKSQLMQFRSQLITIPSISDQPVPGRSPLELLAAEQFLPGEREFQLVKPYVKYVVTVRVKIREATPKNW